MIMVVVMAVENIRGGGGDDGWGGDDDETMTMKQYACEVLWRCNSNSLFRRKIHFFGDLWTSCRLFRAHRL